MAAVQVARSAQFAYLKEDEDRQFWSSTARSSALIVSDDGRHLSQEGGDEVVQAAVDRVGAVPTDPEHHLVLRPFMFAFYRAVPTTRSMTMPPAPDSPVRRFFSLAAPARCDSWHLR